GLLQVPQQWWGAAASGRELLHAERLRHPGSGHGLDQRLVRGFQLALQEASDHGEREAPLLELADPAQALQVGLRIPGDAAVSTRRLQEALALIEADGVDGDPSCSGQLFDAILHE